MFCSVSSSTGCPSSEWRCFEVNDSTWSPVAWRIPSSECGMLWTNPSYYLRFCPIEWHIFDIACFSTYFFCSSLEICPRKPIWDESDCWMHRKSSLCGYGKIHTNRSELYPISSGSGDRRHQWKRFIQKMDERVIIWSYLVSVSNLQYNSHCVPSQKNLVSIWWCKHYQWRYSHLRICVAKSSGLFARFWRNVWVSCVWMGR